MAGVTLFSPPITNQAKPAVERREGEAKKLQRRRELVIISIFVSPVCVCAVIIHYPQTTVEIKEGGFGGIGVKSSACRGIDMYNILGLGCGLCDIFLPLCLNAYENEC